MDSNRLFVIACAWVVVAGSLLSNGLVHRVLPVFIAGLVMSVICPLGLTAAWTVRRHRAGRR
jgi:hypothetical protein